MNIYRRPKNLMRGEGPSPTAVPSAAPAVATAAPLATVEVGPPAARPRRQRYQRPRLPSATPSIVPELHGEKHDIS